MNDTPKRTRDILLSSYALRFPELIKLPEFKSLLPANGSSSALKEEGDSNTASTSSDLAGGTQDATSHFTSNSKLMSGYIQNANTLASVPEDAVNKKVRSGVANITRQKKKLSTFSMLSFHPNILLLIQRIHYFLPPNLI